MDIKMKKTTILLPLIPVLMMVNGVNAAEIYNHNANKLDLYGKVAGLHYFSSTKAHNGDNSYGRLGFKGTTQINDAVSGYGQWEYNIPLSLAETSPDVGQNTTRLGFAGINLGDVGSFDYGRNYGVLYNIESWTDMMPEFGGNTWANTDNFLTGRSTGVATWNNTSFFGLMKGLHIALQYQGENDRPDAFTANGAGEGVSATWSTDSGVSIGGAISHSQRTHKQSLDGKGESADAWTTGVKFDADSIYLAAMYAETRNMTPVKGTEGFARLTKNVELVGQYQFSNGLRPSLGYLQSTGSGLTGKGAQGSGQQLVKYIEAGMTYYFNKNMNIYADYKINLLKENDYTRANNVATDNIVATGLVYQF